MMSASEQVRYYAYWCFERIEALLTVQKQGRATQGLTRQGLARSRNDFPRGL
jgi:hypothetical protein